MSIRDAKPKSALGFLTVVDHPQHGLCGGYLILSTHGRPWNSIAPHRSSRTGPNEILYGPTLEPFLYGEQIGQTLLGKARTEPLAVCTDREPVLAVRATRGTPGRAGAACAGAAGCRTFGHCTFGRWCIGGRALAGLVSRGPCHGPCPALLRFRLGCNELAVLEGADEDRRLIRERLAAVAETFDLAEPFVRIREAIEGAERAAPAPDFASPLTASQCLERAEREKGTGTFCAKHRAPRVAWSGRSGKRCLSPFPEGETEGEKLPRAIAPWTAHRAGIRRLSPNAQASICRSRSSR